ncbi:hypothetical protein PVAP13_6KG071735 [Panicum virgatum]|uniref:Berberine/berberine-like domain-containing protein n=1 Tax=Panicum virgatum TaxID=38727 RepID=A0A8T0R844_PANVG|nr:hypothetical protein PVAP13_6KG071735 [Panicum virgatum]
MRRCSATAAATSLRRHLLLPPLQRRQQLLPPVVPELHAAPRLLHQEPPLRAPGRRQAGRRHPPGLRARPPARRPVRAPRRAGDPRAQRRPQLRGPLLHLGEPRPLRRDRPRQPEQRPRRPGLRHGLGRGRRDARRALPRRGPVQPDPRAPGRVVRDDGRGRARRRRRVRAAVEEARARRRQRPGRRPDRPERPHADPRHHGRRRVLGHPGRRRRELGRGVRVEAPACPGAGHHHRVHRPPDRPGRAHRRPDVPVAVRRAQPSRRVLPLDLHPDRLITGWQSLHVVHRPSSRTEASRHVSAGPDLPGAGPRRGGLSEVSWLESAANFAGLRSVADLTNRQPGAGEYAKSKSDYVRAPISMQGATRILRHMSTGPPGSIQLDPYGGAMARVGSGATPFPHRAGHLYSIQYAVTWNASDHRLGRAEERIGWLRSFHEFMARYVSRNPRRAYVNYLDLDLGTNGWANATGGTSGESVARAASWGERYFFTNFDRLVRAKTKVDPENVFNNAQSIPPLRHDDREH